jgi:hypothetical protein
MLAIASNAQIVLFPHSCILAWTTPTIARAINQGRLWSSRKVAAWMAGELNLTSVAPQRGWEALKAIGWSIQKPRPKNPKSATPEEAAAFKKSSPTLTPLARTRNGCPGNAW